MDRYLPLDLQMFAEGGTVAAEGTGAGQAAPEQAAVKVAKNPLANVQYGKQADAPAGADAGATSSTGSEALVTGDGAEQRRAAFEASIKGDNKDLFDERVQQIINARFKETKKTEEQLAAMRPMLDALGSKYGVDASDAAALQKAIDEDESYYAEEADRRGLTVEQLKSMKKMEAENAQLRQMMAAREQEEGKGRLFSRLDRESGDCAQVYPGFDFRQEAGSPETGERFMSLLNSGVDVKTAYEVIHKDELMGGALRYAVAETQKRTVDNIRARGMRPAENGASGSAPAQMTKSDPSKFTKADRDEISRRVLRGERIEL